MGRLNSSYRLLCFLVAAWSAPAAPAGCRSAAACLRRCCPAPLRPCLRRWPLRATRLWPCAQRLASRLTPVGGAAAGYRGAAAAARPLRAAAQPRRPPSSALPVPGSPPPRCSITQHRLVRVKKGHHITFHLSAPWVLPRCNAPCRAVFLEFLRRDLHGSMGHGVRTSTREKGRWTGRAR